MSHIDREASRKARSLATPPPELLPPEPVSGMLAIIRRVGGNLLARYRLDGYEEKAARPIAERLAPVAEPLRAAGLAHVDVPSGEQLLERLEPLYPRTLSGAQEQVIRELHADGRRQFLATLDALAALRTRRLDTAGYLVRVLESAAEIAGAHGERFIPLVGLSFGARPPRWRREAEPPGAVLDRTFRALTGSPASARDGFNANVADVSPFWALPARFAEALEQGKRRGPVAPVPAAADRSRLADERLTRLGRMLGRGLLDGRLAPVQAVELARWALLQPERGETAPPWGTEAQAERFLDSRDYQLRTWLKAAADARTRRT